MSKPKSVGVITRFNPWIGCARVSPGCDNCYAESMAKRYGWHDWQNSTPRHLTSDSYWRQPLRWDRAAERAGTRARVFCASLADVFDPHAPAGARELLWDLISATPNLDWLLLTKRPNLAAGMLPSDFCDQTFPNVWLGASAEDQEHFERRWPILAAIPAAVRFISYEPMLGPLRIQPWHGPGHLDWLIWGGESGPGARSCEVEWARNVTADCEKYGVAVFGKQWGSYANNPLIQEGVPAAQAIGLPTIFPPLGDVKLIDPPSNGKGGAFLNGRLYREFPRSAPTETVTEPTLFAVAG